MLMYA